MTIDEAHIESTPTSATSVGDGETGESAACATPPGKATFFYDDCCPLCRGYTATFTALGWADRTAFSSIDDDTLASLDFDRARHHIPLHDETSGETKYGLDGILDVVKSEAPLLRPIVEHRLVRRGLGHLYWFITYNRRHIVTAAPPASGIDCAPDFAHAPVRAYLAFCAITSTGAAVAAGTGPAVALATATAGTLAATRDASWNINGHQAAGHIGSVAVASSLAGLATKVATKSHPAARIGTGLVAVRKLYLRRWMRTAREPVAGVR